LHEQYSETDILRKTVESLQEEIHRKEVLMEKLLTDQRTHVSTVEEKVRITILEKESTERRYQKELKE
jgi:hypothetical protein